MEKLTYHFSEKIIKERKKIMNVMMIMMLLLIIFFAYVGANEHGSVDFTMMAIIFAIAVPIIIIEFKVISHFMFKKLRETTLVIEEDKFVRIGGKFKEEVLFSDIDSIKVIRDKFNKIALIKLETKKKAMNIYGLDNMDGIADILNDHLPSKAMKNEKKYKVNWNSRGLLIGIMVATALVILLMMKVNLGLYQVFNMVFPLALAIYFLWYKPISKNAGSRFRIFEIIISIIIIISSSINIFSAIMEYISK